MRRRRLLVPSLTALFALAPASPAMAVDIGVVDFQFTPQQIQIAPGETVTWDFTSGGHTTTAVGGQAEYWSSGADTRPAGTAYAHRFTRPGRFQYVCLPHRSFMKGTVTVGTDTVGDTLDGFRTRRGETSVTVAFTLNEPATATYRLIGPTRRTVKRRLGEGRHSFRLRRLEAGSYRATLTAEDDFDKRTTARRRFVVG
jgi:plastocyanin